ncbi:DUF4397 domain-containing protein [Deinococcus aluminii]|uniref:DUF4397 domain-containing protein n=1 Tax=Deinococcus aluminii TaxID=1656885 RepID=A0ABP9XI10_9DEIO
MRTPKTLKALLLSTLFVTATLAATASAAQVYFENGTVGVTQPVDVYVDGNLMFADVATDSLTLSPQQLAAGQHQVVVTPAGLAPGQQDLVSQTINLASDSTYTLTFGEAQDGTGFSQPSLGLSIGNRTAWE